MATLEERIAILETQVIQLQQTLSSLISGNVNINGTSDSSEFPGVSWTIATATPIGIGALARRFLSLGRFINPAVIVLTALAEGWPQYLLEQASTLHEKYVISTTDENLGKITSSGDILNRINEFVSVSLLNMQARNGMNSPFTMPALILQSLTGSQGLNDTNLNYGFLPHSYIQQLLLGREYFESALNPEDNMPTEELDIISKIGLNSVVAPNLMGFIDQNIPTDVIERANLWKLIASIPPENFAGLERVAMLMGLERGAVSPDILFNMMGNSYLTETLIDGTVANSYQADYLQHIIDDPNTINEMNETPLLGTLILDIVNSPELKNVLAPEIAKFDFPAEELSQNPSFYGAVLHILTDLRLVLGDLDARIVEVVRNNFSFPSSTTSTSADTPEVGNGNSLRTI